MIYLGNHSPYMRTADIGIPNIIIYLVQNHNIEYLQNNQSKLNTLIPLVESNIDVVKVFIEK